MNRFDIAQGREPEERVVHPYRPSQSSPPSTGNRNFFIRREGSDKEVRIHAQEIHPEFFQTPGGPGIIVNMAFQLTQEQSHQLFGTPKPLPPKPKNDSDQFFRHF